MITSGLHTRPDKLRLGILSGSKAEKGKEKDNLAVNSDRVGDCDKDRTTLQTNDVLPSTFWSTLNAQSKHEGRD